MITIVRQITLSITTLAGIYGVLLIILHKSLRSPITRRNLIPRHILVPLIIYGSGFFIGHYYTTSEQLKKLLPIQSGLVRNALADLLSQSVGLSISLLSIVAITVIAVDKLIYFYSGGRIPQLISYLITLSLASISYYTFYVTLSAKKAQVATLTKVLFTLFLWLEGTLGVIILMTISLIITSYIRSKFKKVD